MFPPPLFYRKPINTLPFSILMYIPLLFCRNRLLLLQINEETRHKLALVSPEIPMKVHGPVLHHLDDPANSDRWEDIYHPCLAQTGPFKVILVIESPWNTFNNRTLILYVKNNFPAKNHKTWFISCRLSSQFWAKLRPLPALFSL